MRRWHEWAAYDWQVMVTPQMVQVLTSGAMNFVTNIHVGREFRMVDPVPRLGENVPRWYGETIGFWDEDTLITWTSNIQAWASHTAFEHSNRMQSITECIQTIYPVKGTATPVTPGRILEYEVPDMYGRPWAHLWDKYWEQDMKRPEQADIFDFSNEKP